MSELFWLHRRLFGPYPKMAIMDIRFRYGLERSPWWLLGMSNGDRIERHDRLLEAPKQ